MDGVGGDPYKLSALQGDRSAVHGDNARSLLAVDQFTVFMEMRAHRPTVVNAAAIDVIPSKILILVFQASSPNLLDIL